MIQMPLLASEVLLSKTIMVDGIRASVVEEYAGQYQILLEINSNKIMIAMQGAWDFIEAFEIVAVR